MTDAATDDPRIVSLLPSATEIVYALGLEPVGVSHECDYPPAAKGKPAVNRSKVDPDADSETIDEQVTEADTEGGVYGIDEEALAAVDPDLIVTQGVCDVCAVDHTLVREAVEDLGLDAEILTTHPHSLGDVLGDIRAVGEATGRPDRAAELVAELRVRIEAVERRAAGAERAPRTLVFDWLAPVMVGGHWVPEMGERLGVEYGLAAPGDRSRPHEWTDIRAFDPEVIVAAPCGFSLEHTLEDMHHLTEREGWADLTAVKQGRVYAMDGHHFMNRPGPRIVDSFEHLAGLVYPDRFERPPGDVARDIAVSPSP